jgi:hypothetical protein
MGDDVRAHGFSLRSESSDRVHVLQRIVFVVVGGAMIATVLADGRLDMRYHHLNDKGDFMLSTCLSTPERLPDGRLRFKEQWQWLSGDMSSGSSEIEEVLQ